MAISVGPARGTLILRTSRQGLAAQAGHDLTIEVTRWSGEAVVAEDPAASSVTVTADTGSLRVVAGSGGVKPLTEREKQEIAATARRLLGSDRRPEARFTSAEVSPGGDGGATVTGTLALLGRERPLRLEVAHLGGGRYRATGRVVQSEYGIKPYSAFFGALKLADAVEVEAELDLSAP
ncbi:YceI family protein [Planobispora takensis]|uniref:Polyisoprenoid-binding protein n=1 Tax=Planobispora takensis TaxID=1367882 RepID=A0A8J3WRZ5_9ACTN|nr:YceI family protein [Planobispora takensis]GII00144.1 polyisoprenoid-binding protein [Planobispora takensis]